MRQNVSRTLTNLAPVVAVLALSGLLARLAIAGGAGRVCKTKQTTQQVQFNKCNSVLGPRAECTPAIWLLHQSSCVTNQDGGDCEENACNEAVTFFYKPRYRGDFEFFQCTNLSGTCWSCMFLAGAAGTFPGPHKFAAWCTAFGCTGVCRAAGILDFPACCYNECVETGLPLYEGQGTTCPL